MKRYLLFPLIATAPLYAADISVVGVFPGKAVLVIDDGPPKTYAAGQKITSDITLISVDGNSAVIMENGKRQTIPLGDNSRRTSNSDAASVILSSDGRGHFLADGQINGSGVRMLVDTGATMIALPASEASRLGINYHKGIPGHVNTANGITNVYKVKLDRVRIGDIEVHQVDAVVQEKGLPIILLGMSFLNRMEMRHSGDQMTLTKRY